MNQQQHNVNKSNNSKNSSGKKTNYLNTIATEVSKTTEDGAGFGIKEFESALEYARENISLATDFVKRRPVLVIGSALAVGAVAAVVLTMSKKRMASMKARV